MHFLLILIWGDFDLCLKTSPLCGNSTEIDLVLTLFLKVQMLSLSSIITFFITNVTMGNLANDTHSQFQSLVIYIRVIRYFIIIEIF